MKNKKVHKIITSKAYQNAVYEIVNQFTDEKEKIKLIMFFMNDENFKIILPLYNQYIKDQLTDSGIKFLAIKIYQTIKS